MNASKTDERGALFVTADSEDPRFNVPYIDVREWRDEPTFSRPGTYFPALRVASQREGDPSTRFARTLNLDRVRVVVNE